MALEPANYDIRREAEFRPHPLFDPGSSKTFVTQFQPGRVDDGSVWRNLRLSPGIETLSPRRCHHKPLIDVSTSYSFFSFEASIGVRAMAWQRINMDVQAVGGEAEIFDGGDTREAPCAVLRCPEAHRDFAGESLVRRSLVG